MSNNKCIFAPFLSKKTTKKKNSLSNNKKTNQMKALRFLGILLLAGTMMCVSCKKDEPKPDDNTTENPGGGGGENPGGGGGQTVTEKITVTFDGETWEPGYINQNYDYPYEGAHYNMFDLWIEDGNYLPSSDGTLALDANSDQPYRMNYYKETGYNLNTTDGGQIAVGDWAWLGSNYNDPKTVTGMAFDATTFVASYKVVAPMIDVLAYFQDNETVVKNLTVQYQNVTLVPYEEGSKGLNNQKFGKILSISKASK